MSVRLDSQLILIQRTDVTNSASFVAANLTHTDTNTYYLEFDNVAYAAATNTINLVDSTDNGATWGSGAAQYRWNDYYIGNNNDCFRNATEATARILYDDSMECPRLLSGYGFAYNINKNAMPYYSFDFSGVSDYGSVARSQSSMCDLIYTTVNAIKIYPTANFVSGFISVYKVIP
jgi:hypothetical protein